MYNIEAHIAFILTGNENNNSSSMNEAVCISHVTNALICFPLSYKYRID